MNPIKFGERLKEHRLKAGLTQEELAKQVYVDRSAISHYEIGEKSPTLKTAERLSNILGVSIDELVKGNETSKQ